MESGVFCGSYGGIFSECGLPDHRMISIVSESPDESGTTYHRRTRILGLGRSLKTVKCSESSWIAVHGKECMCVVTRDIAEEKSEKPDLFQIFSYSSKLPVAVVSVILGTNEVCVGNGIADSFSEYNEILAINYLRQKLMKGPDLTYEETLQIAISAFGLLLPGNINANEVKICVARKNEPKTRRRLRRKYEPSLRLRRKYEPSLVIGNEGMDIPRILPMTEVAALLNANSIANQGNQSTFECELCGCQIQKHG